MTKALQMIIQLPFAGFYGSRYSEALDYEESQWVQYATDQYATDSADSESKHPEDLRLTDSELCDLLMSHTSYHDSYISIAKAYCDAFNNQALESFGFELGLKFESMTSPREYNFETDRLFAHIPRKTVLKLWALSKAESHKTLAEVIKGRHSSRDGFWSHYPNDLSDWTSKHVTSFDHNELETLLIAAIGIVENRAECASDGVDSFMRAIDESMFDETELFYSAWSDSVQWSDFESARDELRAEKLDDLRESIPELCADLETRPIRCDKTLDLFANA